MAIEKVEAYFKSFGLQERIIKLEESSETDCQNNVFFSI